MKLLLAIGFLSLLGVSAYAKKNCTELPKEKWMTEDAFKQKAEGMGYKIRKFKQPGSCYEIYGTNTQGQEVEVYFNPVDASIVKEKVE